MNLDISIKSLKRTVGLIKFQKRTTDWWILTILPLILIFVVALVSYFNKGVYGALSVCIQQILTFSFVLSSTDLALRSRINKEDECSRLIPLIPLIVAFSAFIIYVALIDKILLEVQAEIIYGIFMIVTLMIGYFSILLYNNNPLSNPFKPDYVKEKINQEEEDVKKFESGDEL